MACLPYLLLLLLVLVGCSNAEPTIPAPSPTATLLNTRTFLETDTAAATVTVTQSAAVLGLSQPPTLTPIPTSTTVPSPTSTATPAKPQYATLDEFWAGHAVWKRDVEDTGLPLGESDTVFIGEDEYWSYLHASYQSAGVLDQCGDPVPFPGCTTLWKSYDGGERFALEQPSCLFSCASCPCENRRDHIEQQQYPRVFRTPEKQYLVYEFGAYVYLRTSLDGISWSDAYHVPGTWIWDRQYGLCDGDSVIGLHPHIHQELQYDCLVGGPPGIFIEGNQIYVFVALGQAPGHMACFAGDIENLPESFIPCSANPLFQAEAGYGSVESLGIEANPYFEFRTISSADVVKVGERYYMTYEGVRGPSSYTVVDDQFGLGLARSAGPEIDGPWEKYPGNPIITDLPGNVGLGHADLVIVDDITYLFTATQEGTRARYVLVKEEPTT